MKRILCNSGIITTILLAASFAHPAQRTRAEVSLVGITLGESLTDVEAALGSPVRVTDTPIKDVTWRAGEREYDFDRQRIVIKVFEAYYQKPGMRSEHSSGVFSISIQGIVSHRHSVTTGRGLALVDSVDTIRKLYGQAPCVNNHVQLRWANGNVLDIDLDSRGKVREIELRQEEE